MPGHPRGEGEGEWSPSLPEDTRCAGVLTGSGELLPWTAVHTMAAKTQIPLLS